MLEESQPKSYQVFARRTRPQSFSELVGQEVIAHALETMIDSKRIPHAFLFTGTRGVGKTSSARILAKSLCCENGPTITPCQECVHCKQITACAHGDVLEIDGASNTGVDNVRELQESARFYPSSARYKVYIIDEVHMLSQGAFNALLKTLEEPPEQVVFILATTELHKVPSTVRSRCMLFAFKKVEPAKIAQHLQNILVKDKIEFDDDSLQLIAREAKGSLRDALSLLEQVVATCGKSKIIFSQTKLALGAASQDFAEKIFVSICERDSGSALRALEEIDAAGMDLGVVFDDVAHLFKGAIIHKEVKDSPAKLSHLLQREAELVEGHTKSMSVAALSEVFRLLSTGARDAIKSNHALAWAQVITLDCVSRADWLSAGEILQAVKGTGGLPLTRSKKEVVAPIARASDEKKTLAGGKGKVDLPLLGNVIKYIQEKNLSLATKLKHAVFDIFDETHIEFAQVPQNQIYALFSKPDESLISEALKACGISAEIKGVKSGETSPKERPSHLQPAAKELEFKGKVSLRDMKDLDVFGDNSEALQSKKNFQIKQSEVSVKKEELKTVCSAGVSLSNTEKVENIKQTKDKEERLKQSPLLKHIMNMASSVEFIPLESSDKLSP